ncbi:MAG: hypothetical protein NT062_26850 [Proteobacteria bacterium]|nr:hypothetical protein [Pseudomonadota bacterium]
MTSFARLLLIPLTMLALLVAPRVAHADGSWGAALTVKQFISAQVDAIKAGDLPKVKAGLSTRQQGKITAEMLAKAKKSLGATTIDDLVASVEPSPDAKEPTTVKVKMKNGRTLTTLMKVDGKVVADTIWFK